MSLTSLPVEIFANVLVCACDCDTYEGNKMKLRREPRSLCRLYNASRALRRAVNAAADAYRIRIAPDLIARSGCVALLRRVLCTVDPCNQYVSMNAAIEAACAAGFCGDLYTAAMVLGILRMSDATRKFAEQIASVYGNGAAVMLLERVELANVQSRFPPASKVHFTWQHADICMKLIRVTAKRPSRFSHDSPFHVLGFARLCDFFLRNVDYTLLGKLHERVLPELRHVLQHLVITGSRMLLIELLRVVVEISSKVSQYEYWRKGQFCTACPCQPRCLCIPDIMHTAYVRGNSEFDNGIYQLLAQTFPCAERIRERISAGERGDPWVETCLSCHVGDREFHALAPGGLCQTTSFRTNDTQNVCNEYCAKDGLYFCRRAAVMISSRRMGCENDCGHFATRPERDEHEAQHRKPMRPICSDMQYFRRCRVRMQMSVERATDEQLLFCDETLE